MAWHICFSETGLLQIEPAGWVRLTESRFDAFSRESIARHYLSADEWKEYRAYASQRRHWLRGRVAAKEAVRSHLYACGAELLSAAAIEIRIGAHGRPVVNTPLPRKICVSIAHSGDLAVALSDEEAVGIDVEAVRQNTSGLERFVFSAKEQILFDQLVRKAEHDCRNARSKMFTRFWTAKEAVSKAEGTGLCGKPSAFAVRAVEGDCLHVVSGTGRHYTVQTSQVSGSFDVEGRSTEYIVAWTYTHSHLDSILHDPAFNTFRFDSKLYQQSFKNMEDAGFEKRAI